jgi:hypothetical protein
MMTLRCTRKLLEALRAPPADEPAPTSTVLGDWYANLYEAQPGRVVLCLNERSLLAVLVEFGDAPLLVRAIGRSVADLLARIGVPEDSIRLERVAMANVQLGPTANRRVLGCLNEAAFAISHEFDAMHPKYFCDHENYLSRLNYSTTGYQPPHALARELFEAACPGSRPNLALIH